MVSLWLFCINECDCARSEAAGNDTLPPQHLFSPCDFTSVKPPVAACARKGRINTKKIYAAYTHSPYLSRALSEHGVRFARGRWDLAHHE